MYTIDSLLGTIPHPQIGGTTRSIFIPLVQLAELEEAIQARDKLGEYKYLVMNPPYVRNERLPEEPRDHYRKVFGDVAAMNADISTSYLQRKLRIGYPRAARIMEQLEEESTKREEG
jgi:DNA segregation ATPase FtsK/SpoIIIE-like protein